MRKLLILILLFCPRFLLAAGPTKIERVLGTPTNNAQATQTKYQLKFNNAAAAGDAIFIGCTLGTGSDPISSITDNAGGNTWNKDKINADTTNNQTFEVISAVNVTANTRVVTLNFSSAIGSNQCLGILANNIATSSALDISCSAIVTSGTAPQCGSMTPSQVNDFIVVFENDDSGTLTYSTFTAGSGFTLSNLDPGSELAGEYQTYNSTSAINPSITWSQTVSRVLVAGAGYKTVASSGGSVCSFCVVTSSSINFNQPNPLGGTSTTFDFPCGDCNALDLAYQSNDTVSVSAISSSPSNTWSASPGVIAGAVVSIQHETAGSASTSATMRITLTLSAAPAATSNAFLITVWGLKGAGAIDTNAHNSGNSGSSSGTISSMPTIVTAQANEIILDYENEEKETVTSSSVNLDTIADLQGDIGTYETFAAWQDGGIANVNATTAGSHNISFTFSAYETGTPAIGNWAAEAIAWKQAAAAPSPNAINKQRKLEIVDDPI